MTQHPAIEPRSMCFLDRERICGSDCKAFNQKTQGCKLLERSAGISGAFKQMTAWLGQRDPPGVG